MRVRFRSRALASNGPIVRIMHMDTLRHVNGDPAVEDGAIDNPLIRGLARGVAEENEHSDARWMAIRVPAFHQSGQ